LLRFLNCLHDIYLVEDVLLSINLALLSQQSLRFDLRTFQVVLFLFDSLDTIQFLLSLLGESFNLGSGEIRILNILIGPNDIF
jgi:hypothetical protein